MIERARLRERSDGLWSIGIADGEIRSVDASPLEAAERLDADGQLVTPTFASAHLHLCKVHTLAMVGEDALRRYSAAGMGDAMGAIELAAKVKERYAADWIADNAVAALRQGLAHGITAVRAFADVDVAAGLEGVKGVLRARDEVAGLVDVQVVAFPQDGLVRDPGALELLRDAMALGADVVGGIPWIELTDDDASAHVEQCLDLAIEHDADVAMLVDDAGDPGLRTTEMLAVAAIERGWTGRVTACHARALATYPEPTLRRLIELARCAGLAFVSNPHTGPLHLPIRTLLDAGLTVALGQDDIEDAYYPFGQHNLLEVAFLAAHVLHDYTLADMDRLFDMIGGHARRSMGLDARTVDVGQPADLALLDGASVHQALLRHRPPRAVLRAGRVVARTETTTTFSDNTP